MAIHIYSCAKYRNDFVSDHLTQEFPVPDRKKKNGWITNQYTLCQKPMSKFLYYELPNIWYLYTTHHVYIMHHFKGEEKLHNGLVNSKDI